MLVINVANLGMILNKCKATRKQFIHKNETITILTHNFRLMNDILYI